MGAHTASLRVPAQHSPILTFPNGIVGLGEDVAEAPGVTQRLSPCPSHPLRAYLRFVPPLERACSSAHSCGGASSLQTAGVSSEGSLGTWGDLPRSEHPCCASAASCEEPGRRCKAFCAPALSCSRRCVRGAAWRGRGLPWARQGRGTRSSGGETSEGHVKGSRLGKLSHGVVNPCGLLASARRDWTRS